MNKLPLSKIIFFVLITAFAVVLILPTVGEKTMRVDLMSTASESDIAAITARFPENTHKVELKDKTIFIKGYDLSDAVMNDIKTYSFVSDAVMLRHWAEKYALAKKINLGLDLQGGMSLVLQADYAKMEEKSKRKFTDADKKEITAQALEKISNRINTFGVSEPDIRPKGTDAIEVQLPGVRNPDGVKKAIGTTGSVSYHLVDEELSNKAAQYVTEKAVALPDVEKELNVVKQSIVEALQIPQDKVLYFFYDRDEETKKIFPSYPMVLDKEASLAGNDIATATEGYDDMNRLAVNFTTTADGATKFADVTSKKNHGRRLAIVIDEKVRSAPSLNVQITGGKAIIEGNFTSEEVKVLSRIINEGALPVDLRIEEERTVGPSLGQDAIESGVKALMVAGIGIIFFMILRYKAAGIIADVCLVLNMVYLLALLSWLGFTLTLPGLAGLILTIGMAVDANVIIYERIKEELAAGKSPRIAVTTGYDKAFWTIMDSNITTILAGFILSQVGTGPIKGFAVTLIIGILTSMFAALFVSKLLFTIVIAKKNMTKIYI